jgi:hypothetical protein
VSLDPLPCELNRDYFAAARSHGGNRRRSGRGCLRVLPRSSRTGTWNQDTVTHRYRRYAGIVGICISLKETWHYPATQLLAAGVDHNTVAGRPPGRRPGRAQIINDGILSRSPGRLRRQVQEQVPA